MATASVETISWSQKNRIRLADFSKMYSSSIGARVVNDSFLSGKKINTERIEKLFYNIDPELGFVASCECKMYRGNYYSGHKCPYCGTVVSSEFATDMSHVNWLVIPEHLPPIIHPVFFMVMKEWLGKTKSTNPKSRNKVSLMQALLDPAEELPYPVRTHIHGQGFKYFAEHHEDIMKFFLDVYRPTKNKKEVPYIRAMYDEYKHLLLIRTFPTLHPTLTPIAKEGRIRTIDPAASVIMAAMSDLSTLGFESRRCIVDSKYSEKMLWKVYNNIVTYVETIITKKFGDKFAHARRHLMGARIHYSARSVIVPIIEPHRGDEIHLPWKIALGALKPEILNVLMNRLHKQYQPDGTFVKAQYQYNEAYAKYMKALVVFDQDICDIINTLIKECPYKGLPVLCGRNPR